jgi:uncharacterized Zn finger protein (UPF0148 family)
MKAADFERYRCRVGDKTVSYATLTREWRCNECGGALVEKWSEGGWRVECGRCGGSDFVHSYELRRQKHEAEQILESLPPELTELYREEA